MRRALIAALAMAALALAGCGDDAAWTTTTEATTPTGGTNTSLTPTTTSTDSRPTEFFDGLVGIAVLDTGTRSAAPPDLDLPPARPGHAYLSVHLAVLSIESVHLTNLLGYQDAKPFGEDATGIAYELAAGNVSGIRFTDPSDISSPSEVVAGAESVLVFEVPADSPIARMVLIYSYRQTWDDASVQRGEIELLLDSET